MGNSKLKSAFITSVALAIVACTNNIPNNTRLTQENFQDLDREYVFSTKELTQSYLNRKIRNWYDTGNGTKLVKEIAYARYKHPLLFCAVMEDEDNQGLLENIKLVQEVIDRSEADSNFNVFLESCGPGSNVPANFQVNSYITDDQKYPSVAMDNNGDFVIAWTSYGQNGTSGEIFARRYGSNGLPLGSEFHVNTSTVNNERYPVVVMDSDGDFVITWNSILTNFSNAEVFAQRYDKNGVPQGTEFQVNTYTTAIQWEPAAAMDNNGDFIITWTSNGPDGQGNGVFGQRYDSNGAPQGIEFQVNTFTRFNEQSSKVAMDSAGDFVVAWSSYGHQYEGDPDGVYAQRYNSSGIRQGSEFQINLYTTFGQNNPSIAMDDIGNFVVAWQSYLQDGRAHGIFAKRYDSSGNSPGSEFQVNTYTLGSQNFANIAMDSDGDFVISWQSGYSNNNDQDGSQSGIFAQRYDSSGNPQGTEFLVNTSYTTGYQLYNSAAMDSSGNFVVTWDSGYSSSNNQDGDKMGIFAQRYNSSGAAQ
jgi:hypothetical protein